MIPSICRVCLRGDLRTQQIVDDKLLELHHKLTDTTKLVHDVGLALCYICCSILQRCRRYSDMSQESDRLLQGLMDNGIEITQEIINTLKQKRLKTIFSLTTIKIPTFNYNENPDHESTDSILCKGEYDETIDEGTLDDEEVQLKEELVEFEECYRDDKEVEIKKEDLHIGGCIDIKEKVIEMTSLETRLVRFEDSYQCVKTENTSKQQFENKNVHLQLHNYAMPYSRDMSHDELNNQSDAKPTCDNAGLISNLRTHDTELSKMTASSPRRRHLLTGAGKRLYTCTVCDASFTRHSVLKEHNLANHSGENPFVCKTCGKKFQGSRYLRYHLKTHTREKPYYCDVCGERFSSSMVKLAHMKIHTGNTPYPCEQCGKEFYAKRNLKRHVERMHTDGASRNKKRPCSLCVLTFLNRNELNNHTRTTHSGGKPTCDTCGKVFINLRLLSRHLRIHTGKPEEPVKRRHTCTLCDVSFTRYNVLKEHNLANHSDKNPFVCKTCGKTLRRSSSLREHMKSHAAEKPYSCDECGKRFTANNSKRNHMMIHTGDRPYPCKLCSKAYYLIGEYKIHMRTHTGEKPFVCEQCGKAFSYKNSLRNHIRLFHGKKKYSCDKCSKGFNVERLYTMHMRKHTRL